MNVSTRTRLALVGTGLLAVGALRASYRTDRPLSDVDPDYTNEKSEFLDLPNTRVHYRDTGKGSPLLLLHGAGSSLHAWSKWTKYLQDSYRLLRLDLPGFGLSDPGPSFEHSLIDYVETLHRFLERRKTRSVRIAGNAFGGRLALRYALEHPEKIERIVLLNPTGFEQKSFLPSSLFHPSLPTFTTRFTPRFLVSHYLKKLYGKADRLEPDVVDRYYELLLRAGNRENLQRFVGSIKTPDEVFERFLRKIDAPVLIQWGCRDPWLNVTFANRYQHILPNSSLITYLSAGHLPMEEIPEQTAYDALSFFNRNKANDS